MWPGADPPNPEPLAGARGREARVGHDAGDADAAAHDLPLRDQPHPLRYDTYTIFYIYYIYNTPFLPGKFDTPGRGDAAMIRVNKCR